MREACQVKLHGYRLATSATTILLLVQVAGAGRKW